MAGTSAKTGSTVEIVNITPRRRWSVGEKVRLIDEGDTIWSGGPNFRVVRKALP